MGDCFSFELNGIDHITLTHAGDDMLRMKSVAITMEDDEIYECVLNG